MLVNLFKNVGKLFKIVLKIYIFLRNCVSNVAKMFVLDEFIKKQWINDVLIIHYYNILKTISHHFLNRLTKITHIIYPIYPIYTIYIYHNKIIIIII